MASLAATAVVPAPRDEVFDFLADLENHWVVADRFVEVVALAGPPGARHGGVVTVRGPLGIRRTATTRVVSAEPPARMCGSAELGRHTVATVRWTLAPDRGGTRVRLAATVERAGAIDRVLLLLGGRAWLRRRFGVALRTLAARFEGRRGEATRTER